MAETNQGWFLLRSEFGGYVVAVGIDLGVHWFRGQWIYDVCDLSFMSRIWLLQLQLPFACRAGRRRNERCRFAVIFLSYNYDMWPHLAPEDVQRKGINYYEDPVLPTISYALGSLVQHWNQVYDFGQFKFLEPQFLHLCNKVLMISLLCSSQGCYKVPVQQWAWKVLSKELFIYPWCPAVMSLTSPALCNS